MERFRLQSVNVDQVKDLIRKQPGVTYLEDSMTNIQGIKIWGTPWFSFIHFFKKIHKKIIHSFILFLQKGNQNLEVGVSIYKEENLVLKYFSFFFLKQKEKIVN